MENKTERRETCCRTLGKAFKYEWNWRHLGLGGADYQQFPFAQWMWMDAYFYPICQSLLAIGLVIWTCVEIAMESTEGRKGKSENSYFLYATNWSFLMYTLSSIAFAVFCTVYNFKKGAKVSKCVSQILWFFFGMSMNTVLVTSLAYWAAIWEPSYHHFYLPESRLKHALPACTVVLEACINGLPIRLFHALYPMIFGIIYAVFSYLYYDAGNIHPIYPLLDWSKPVDAAFACLLTVGFSSIMQLVLFLIYVGRITLSASLGGRGEVVVKDWWKAGSKVKSAKEDSKDIEVVERKEVKEEEVSMSSTAKAKVENETCLLQPPDILLYSSSHSCLQED
ncbi:unnamed protein product [Hymenolepis diminuta]|uniref:Protein rolling stone n=1 Tax=Hymenolepis diminuta TaxID=6216 RepID=A0A0R3SE59_HYMDI|nr:unnamed protein product [Hymenolepis diminuta]